jgi:hypothetical protein
MPDQRPKRACDVCGGVDDHPRHVMSVPPDFPGAVPSAEIIRTAISNGATDEMVAALLAPDTVIRHMDCCADAGCLDGSCTQVLTKAGSKRRDDLTRHLETQVRALDKAKG